MTSYRDARTHLKTGKLRIFQQSCPCLLRPRIAAWGSVLSSIPTSVHLTVYFSVYPSMGPSVHLSVHLISLNHKMALDVSLHLCEKVSSSVGTSICYSFIKENLNYLHENVSIGFIICRKLQKHLQQQQQ